jgi:hypothetical protein
MMKKWIVLIMALTFALGLTSMVFAADEKLPVDTKATPGKGVGVPKSALGPEEKIQMDEAKKKTTVKKKPVVKKPIPGMGPEEKIQMEEAKKPSTADKMKEKKDAPAAPAAEVPAKK